MAERGSTLEQLRRMGQPPPPRLGQTEQLRGVEGPEPAPPAPEVPGETWFVNSGDTYKKLPEAKFWVIVTLRQEQIPGDKRSEEAPGHGYPAHTLTYPGINVFTDRRDWMQEVEKLTLDRALFKAWEVLPAVVKTKTTIEVRAS